MEPNYQIRSTESPCVLLSRTANCIYLLSLACSVSQAEREPLVIHEYFTSSIYMKAKPRTTQVRRLGIEKEGRKRHREEASRQEISFYLFFFHTCTISAVGQPDNDLQYPDLSRGVQTEFRSRTCLKKHSTFSIHILQIT